MNNLLRTTSTILISLLLFSGCKSRDKTTNIVAVETGERIVRYSTIFSINIYDDYKEITVSNPWNLGSILHRYILVDKKAELPDNMPEGTIIRTPIENVIALSTIHCSILKRLNAIETIKGVCDAQYININEIQNGLKDQSITDFGQVSGPNIEKIIESEPEAIFVTPVQEYPYGTIAQIGIPLIETPDYVEPNALARAEWIKFYALFVDKEELADSLFNETEKKYQEIKEKVATTTNRPTVFMDLMYRGSWYIPGGNSNIASMLKDAGANYIWRNNNSNKSTPYPFEKVLNDAEDADIWMIKYNNSNTLTYKSLAKENKGYTIFSAFKDKKIYECNTQKKNYYEELPINPEYILEEFAAIFHPELFPDYKPRYYEKMKD